MSLQRGEVGVVRFGGRGERAVFDAIALAQRPSGLEVDPGRTAECRVKAVNGTPACTRAANTVRESRPAVNDTEGAADACDLLDGRRQISRQIFVGALGIGLTAIRHGACPSSAGGQVERLVAVELAQTGQPCGGSQLMPSVQRSGRPLGTMPVTSAMSAVLEPQITAPPCRATEDAHGAGGIDGELGEANGGIAPAAAIGVVAEQPTEDQGVAIGRRDATHVEFVVVQEHGRPELERAKAGAGWMAWQLCGGGDQPLPGVDRDRHVHALRAGASARSQAATPASGVTASGVTASGDMTSVRHEERPRTGA